MNPKGNDLFRNTKGAHPRSKRVACYDLEEKLVEEFESVTDASETMGISQPAISNAIKRKGKAGRFYWRFV